MAQDNDNNLDFVPDYGTPPVDENLVHIVRSLPTPQEFANRLIEAVHL